MLKNRIFNSPIVLQMLRSICISLSSERVAKREMSIKTSKSDTGIIFRFANNNKTITISGDVNVLDTSTLDPVRNRNSPLFSSTLAFIFHFSSFSSHKSLISWRKIEQKNAKRTDAYHQISNKCCDHIGSRLPVVCASRGAHPGQTGDFGALGGARAEGETGFHRRCRKNAGVRPSESPF